MYADPPDPLACVLTPKIGQIIHRLALKNPPNPPKTSEIIWKIHQISLNPPKIYKNPLEIHLNPLEIHQSTDNQPKSTNKSTKIHWKSTNPPIHLHQSTNPPPQSTIHQNRPSDYHTPKIYYYYEQKGHRHQIQKSQ